MCQIKKKKTNALDTRYVLSLKKERKDEWADEK
jgi:hypothetical protein